MEQPARPSHPPRSNRRAGAIALGWAAAFALLLSASLAQAQWVWKDSAGGLNASDLPPPRSVPDKDIVRRPAGASRPAVAAPEIPASAAVVRAAASPPAKPAVDSELERRRKAAEQEKATRGKADEERLAAQRRDNCERARGQLLGLESGRRMSRMNAQGETEVLDDDARAVEIGRAREVIASDCR